MWIRKLAYLRISESVDKSVDKKHTVSTSSEIRRKSKFPSNHTTLQVISFHKENHLLCLITYLRILTQYIRRSREMSGSHYQSRENPLEIYYNLRCDPRPSAKALAFNGVKNFIVNSILKLIVPFYSTGPHIMHKFWFLSVEETRLLVEDFWICFRGMAAHQSNRVLLSLDKLT